MQRMIWKLMRFLYALGTPHLEQPANRHDGTNNALYRLMVWTANQLKVLIPLHIRTEIFNRILAITSKTTGKTENGIPSHVDNFKQSWGVNIIGCFKGELGIGESARSSLRAFSTIPVAVNAVDYRLGFKSRMNEEVFHELKNSIKPYDINLFHVNGDLTLAAYNEMGSDLCNGAYNIGYWVWETTEMPSQWLYATQVLDEIWTASNFCREVIGKKVALPVVRIPHNVSPVAAAQVGREEFGIPKDGFVFLNMADFFSTPERKNPIGCVSAFFKAFGKRPKDIYLVLKISNSKNRPEILETIKKLAKDNESLILLDDYLDRGRVNALISCCDCYVSLHRAEGFGLPLAEAMYFGKPVIATAWSGNMDFMNEDNSFPVRYSLVPIEHDVDHYTRGASWAEPDLDHAAELMKKVVSCPEMVRQISENARETIHGHYSPESVGTMILHRLNAIRDERECRNGSKKQPHQV
ncbi:glycosyltransferase family 4 protein [Desulfomonile tiedjei]|uniref:Glycosyltransferase n=1 Tax=Desulfomonile tiedjei (strain ATCC 49306 / DSM 6799 / DCB-1) TaxID=706587 RepID=I4C1Q1_DESTA|nr:glycosyltransferase family 4 protein [Desulfomonile tiedjei]AFM23492.1 glycosyltransferase [Desulfomonile tiedjei DSM 6799]